MAALLQYRLFARCRVVKWSLEVDAGLELGIFLCDQTVGLTIGMKHIHCKFSVFNLMHVLLPPISRRDWRLHTSNKTTRVGVWKCKGEWNTGPDVNINV